MGLLELGFGLDLGLGSWGEISVRHKKERLVSSTSLVGIYLRFQALELELELESGS